MDFVKPWWPAMPDRALVVTGRIVTAIVMAMAAIYAPIIASFGTLFEYFQSTLAYLVPSIVAIFIGGLTIDWLRKSSAVWAMAIMLPIGLILFLSKEVFSWWSQAGLPPVHFTYMAVILFVATFVFMIAFSLPHGGTRERADPSSVVAASDLAADGTESRFGLLADHRIQAAGLLILTAVVLWLIS